MAEQSRRDFLLRSALGLSAGLSVLTLRADAQPTEASGKADAIPNIEPTHKWAPTEDNILGPFYRSGAPFRGKVTPPLEPGEVLLIGGRVWSFETKRPLLGAVLDIWQANAKGRYDNDDPRTPPAKGVYRNRTRLITDENGYYEFESIRPGRYKIGAETWRPSHIHYMVRAAGHKNLVTQLYFKGDPHNATDEFIKPSLIIDPKKVKVETGMYEVGVFDIVLAAAK